MNYGTLPKILGTVAISPKEMFFYQYLPIKLVGHYSPTVEDRLSCFNELIGKICCDFIGEYGLNTYMDSYVYLTAKRLFQRSNCPFNRPGYHSDGFLTPDINYIWYDSSPTIFNTSNFNLSTDDSLSMLEMEKQAMSDNEVTFPVNSILRLDQYNIHKVSDQSSEGIRTFVKVSFSADKYDLEGNSRNYLLDYDWNMRSRSQHRNIPQSVISKRHPVEN